LLSEVDAFLKANPPISAPSKEEVIPLIEYNFKIEKMILENVEILLEIKRENSKKKNKNTESSAQYNQGMYKNLY
jgi:hypothetical protein